MSQSIVNFQVIQLYFEEYKLYIFLPSFTHLLKILLFSLYSRLSTVLGIERVSKKL